MFCKNCGKELTSGVKFCSKCGTSVAESTQRTYSTHTGYDTSAGDMGGYFQKGNKSKTTKADFDTHSAELDHLLGKKASYYKKAFQKIQTTGVEPFNWSALWLSLQHSAYRGMWRVWLGEMKLPLILSIISSVLSTFGLSISSFSLVAISNTAAKVADIWFFIAQILYAKHFNVMYMHHVDAMLCGEATTEKVTDYKRVFISVGAFWGVIVALCLVDAIIL